MKVCGKCKLDKDNSEFNKNNKKKDGLQAVCKDCNKLNLKIHYSNNTEDYRRRAKDRKREARLFLWNYLKEHPCIDCGESDPIVLEFDHLRDKRFQLSAMASEGSSIEYMKVEIEKCVVRCSNCHKKKTARDFGWYKDFETTNTVI